MAKPTSDTNNTIEALLQQRAQYEQWLARLDSAAGDKAPNSVRERVRSDYEGRLRGVIDELRGHAATITEELEQHREDQRRVDGERQKAEEALAEAEVRYAVGEYTDEEWQRISEESQRQLGGLREELRVVGDEINRLAEVQALIGAPARTPGAAAAAPGAAGPAAAAAGAAESAAAMSGAAERAAGPAASAAVEPPAEATPPAPLAPAPAMADATPVAAAAEPADEAGGVSRGSVKPAGAPSPSPAAPRQPEPIATTAAPPGDELAFLKSVSDEEPRPASAARRASSPGAGAPAPSGAGTSAPAPAKASEPAAPATGAGRTSGVAKTLKCNECGTLNRPTEWYCERCGAELAAL